MIKNQITFYACDLCGKETAVWDEDDNRLFEAEWHTGLALDLCADCRETPRGKAKILCERSSCARLAAEHLKG